MANILTKFEKARHLRSKKEKIPYQPTYWVIYGPNLTVLVFNLAKQQIKQKTSTSNYFRYSIVKN